MADKYVSTGNQATCAATYKTCLAVTGNVLTRGRMQQHDIDAGGAPQDLQILWRIARSTTAGTSTAVVPALTDIGGPAAQLVSGENHSLEPAITAASELLEQEYNFRITPRLTVSPGFEYVIPATANAGVVVQALHATYTGNFRATTSWYE